MVPQGKALDDRVGRWRLLRFGLKPRSRRAAALKDAQDREKVLVMPTEE